MAERDREFFELPPEGFNVYSWSPTPEVDVVKGLPQAACTQVHLHIPIGSVTIVARFKGPGTLDRLIDALNKHREDVFGKR